MIQFDPISGQCITRRGRVYRLFRRPGLNPDALYVRQHSRDLAGLTDERDVTAEVREAMEAAQGTWATTGAR